MLVSTMFSQRAADVRRGYRLHITNLADRTLRYTVRYCVTPPTSEARWAAMLNRFFILYGSNRQIDISPFRHTGSIYVAAASFVVEPNNTVSVGITPDVREFPEEGIDVLEGFVTLELPVTREGQGDLRFRSVPQANGPVKALLNPETTMIHTDPSRAGYTQNLDGVVTGRVSVTRVNFDTVEPLIPASGKAENEITPNGIRSLTLDAFVEAVKLSRTVEAGTFVDVDNLPAADRMGTLIELLCELDTKKELLIELNKVLSKNGASATICQNKS